MSDTTKTAPISQHDAEYHFGWGIGAKAEKLMGKRTCVEAWRQMVTWTDDHLIVVLRLNPRCHARSFQSRTWQCESETFANEFPICCNGDGKTKGLGYISLPPEYEFSPIELEYIAVLKGTWEKMTVGELKTKQEALVIQLGATPVPKEIKPRNDNLQFPVATKLLTEPNATDTCRGVFDGAKNLVGIESDDDEPKPKQAAIGLTLQDNYGTAGFHPSYDTAGLHPQDVMQAIVLNRLMVMSISQNSDDKQPKGG